MREPTILQREDAAGDQWPQDAVQGIGIGAGLVGQLCGCLRGFTHGIGNAGFGDQVQAARRPVGSCQTKDGFSGMYGAHYFSLELPGVLPCRYYADGIDPIRAFG